MEGNRRRRARGQACDRFSVERTDDCKALCRKAVERGVNIVIGLAAGVLQHQIHAEGAAGIDGGTVQLIGVDSYAALSLGAVQHLNISGYFIAVDREGNRINPCRNGRIHTERKIKVFLFS